VKITDIRTVVVGNPWKNWVFAQVSTDEGITGLGEGSANGFARTIEAAIHELKPLVIGEDPTRIEWLNRRLLRDVYTDGGPVHRSAVAAIDIACWDILGKSLDVPVWQLIGGRTRDRVRAYANGWYRTERTPDAIAEAAKVAVGRGFTALKIDPFGSAWRVMDRKDLDLSIDIIAAIRDTVGDSVDILVEGHSRFTVDEAVQIARRLEALQPMWFEEPVRHDRVTAVAEVARRSPVPIATGESFHTLGEFAELGAAGGVAYWQPEAAHLGGLTGLRAVASLAEANDAVMAPHQAGGPVATAVCLTLAACTNNHVIQEFFDPFNGEWAQNLVDWAPQLDSDGCLPIPMRPGIGLELNMDVAESRPYSEENFLAIFQDSWEKRRS
jgi:galactonate dehydratase